MLGFADLAKRSQRPSAPGRQSMNDKIGGEYEQVRRAGGLDVKAEMEHIAINDFIVASFDA